MPQPTLPPELHNKIVDMLEGYHDALKHISETSKAFIPRARPILFRNIRIRSFKHVVQLAELLESKLCTIPTTAQSLEVQFEFPVRGKKQEPYTSDDVTFAMAHVYEHFLSFEVYIGINVPWIFGRRMDWTYLQPYTSLRKFSWTGEYTWLCEITEFLYYMPNLECLIADATFKDDRDPPTTVSLRRGNTPCRVSTTLKELALSPQCLPMMRWFCNLESGRPDSLHTFRIKADSIRHHAAYYYQDIVSFFQKYGKGLAHLYAWFDNCSSSDYDLLEALGDALQHTPNLQHMEVLLAGSWDDEDTKEYTDRIFPFYIRRPTTVRVRAGEFIGLDEAEFWETLSTVCEVGEDRVACERLVELSLAF